MTAQTASKSKALRARVWLFIQGALTGGVFYAVLAFLAYRLYLLPAPQPDWIDYLLGAIFLGPGLAVWLFYPYISGTTLQLISGFILSGLGGIVFLVTGRKWGIVAMVVLYVLLTACLTFLFGMIVMIG